MRGPVLIELYTAPTPNGWKVSMALEELGIPYEVRVVDLMRGDQHALGYLQINPNGRIPAIIDRETNVTIFESGAILIYLAEKTGRLLPADPVGRYDVLQWLMFQMSGIGPMQGQAVSFVRYFPEVVPAAIERYHNETRRLYGVLDARLSDREFLAGEFSIADIANWSWVRSHRWARVAVDGLPHLERWMGTMRARPRCQRGAEIPPSPGKAAEVTAGGRAIVTR